MSQIMLDEVYLVTLDNSATIAHRAPYRCIGLPHHLDTEYPLAILVPESPSLDGSALVISIRIGPDKFDDITHWPVPINVGILQIPWKAQTHIAKEDYVFADRAILEKP